MAVKTKELLQVSNDLNKEISDKWVTIPVKDFAEIINGGAFKSKFFNKAKGIRLVRIRDLTRNRLPTFYDGDYDKMYIVNSGDFLVGMDGDFIGVEWRNGKALLNQRVCKIITNDEIIHPKFFRLGINRYLQKIHSATSYLTVAHLSSNTINNIEFPFPSLSEQKRIVSKIESIFAQIDATRMNLENIRLMLKWCRQSVLKHAFEGKLVSQDPDDEPAEVLLRKIYGGSEKELVLDRNNLPKEWLASSVGQLYKIVGGGTPSTKVKRYWNGDILWISSADIHGLYDIRPRRKITPEAIKNSATNLVPTGSIIVVTRVGLGKIARTRTPLCFSQDSHALIGNASFVDPDYILYYLSQAVQFFKHASRGTTISGVTKKQLVNLPLPIAPFNEQKRIASKIESIFDRIDAVERYVESTLNGLDALKKSTLKQAFEGKLVPQDPNDEPAGILLQKIKQERKQLIQKQKPSRKIKNVK